jgi:hypothetical protein
MTIKCDACGLPFTSHEYKRKEDGIETTFFLCPSCGTQVVICKTNPEIRKLQQRITNMRKRLVTMRFKGKVDAVRLSDFQALIQEHGERLDALNRAPQE